MNISTPSTISDDDDQREARLCQLAQREGYVVAKLWRGGSDRAGYGVFDSVDIAGGHERVPMLYIEELATLDEIEGWLADRECVPIG